MSSLRNFIQNKSTIFLFVFVIVRVLWIVSCSNIDRMMYLNLCTFYLLATNNDEEKQKNKYDRKKLKKNGYETSATVVRPNSEMSRDSHRAEANEQTIK